MPSPYLTFNGVDSKSFDLVMQSVNRQVFPATQDQYVNVPLKDGSYLFPNSLKDRTIAVDFTLVFDTLTDLRIKMRDIANWLNVKNRVKISFSDETDKYYMGKLSKQLDLSQTMRTGTLSVQFRCLPYAYAPLTEYNENYKYDSDLQYDAGLIYPNPSGFNWVYGTQTSSCYNYSFVDAPFIVQIDGTVTNPTITNLTTGDSLVLATSISNQTLLIDSDRKIITIDGENALNYLSSGDFFDLQTGSNKFQFEGTNPNAAVTFQWVHQFM